MSLSHRLVLFHISPVYQGVYQPGKPGNSREFEKSGKNREISGNLVNGQGIFVLCIIIIIIIIIF
jgi:hypothetical protein